MEIQETGQSMTYAENPHDTAVLEANGPEGHFFEEIKKLFLDMV